MFAREPAPEFEMSDSGLRSPWFPFGCGPADAAARMFCLPFAGGGASNFSAWRKRFDDVGVAPVQYPGRETRFNEAPQHNLDGMVAGLAGAIAPWLDRPYVLFGYSMGAKLAFTLIRHLADRDLPPPRALLVAAHVPPDCASEASRAAGMDDPQFKALLRSYGGMPQELLDDEDFCSMIMPVLRADFALAVQAVDLAPIDCPIFAYAGAGDASAPPSVMAGWQRFTRSDFHAREFGGGHFFFRDAPGFEASLRADVAAALGPQRQRTARLRSTQAA
jgi:medium-chain acyl-[acyl-carrier-protein] hydrolase